MQTYLGWIFGKHCPKISILSYLAEHRLWLHLGAQHTNCSHTHLWTGNVLSTTPFILSCAHRYTHAHTQPVYPVGSCSPPPRRLFKHDSSHHPFLRTLQAGIHRPLYPKRLGKIQALCLAIDNGQFRGSSTFKVQSPLGRKSLGDGKRRNPTQAEIS